MDDAIPTCSLDGCDKPRKTRGMCQPHYLKAWKAGDLPDTWERQPIKRRPRASYDPERFPCDHPRTPENTKAGNNQCKACHRVNQQARHHAKRAAEGRAIWKPDPDWFPCGHPRVEGNLTVTRKTCRVCHIERAAKQEPTASRGNTERRWGQHKAAKQCLREERRDPETMAYLAIIRQDPCAYCGGPGGTRDHIVPMTSGGPNRWENYTGACLACNSAKSDTPLLVYLLDRMDLQRARSTRKTA